MSRQVFEQPIASGDSPRSPSAASRSLDAALANKNDAVAYVLTPSSMARQRIAPTSNE